MSVDRPHPVRGRSFLCPQNVCASRNALISNRSYQEEDLTMPKSLIIVAERRPKYAQISNRSRRDHTGPNDVHIAH